MKSNSETKQITKKIDVITKYFYPVAAGIEMNIMEVYSNLVKRGWDVTIHTSNYDYTTKKLLPPVETVRGLKIKREPMWKFYLWPGIKLNRQVVCLHNFNIFPHFNIMLVTSLRKLLGVKNYSLFLIPHGGFSPEWSLFSPLTRLVKSIYHHSVGVTMINSSVDGVRAVAKWEGAEMVRYGVKEKLVTVITNGIENEAYQDIEKLASGEIKNKVRKFGKYLIQIGRIYAIKDQETAIKALAEQSDKKLKFVFVGPVEDTEYLKSLETLISKLSLDGRVAFLGVVRGIDKYFLMKHAFAMVHMAIWEANANVINEAWSQGLICVVADSCGLNEQIRNGVNGYLVPQKDYKGLAQVLNEISKNSENEKLKTMKSNNKKYVADNSWAKVSQKVETLYLSGKAQVSTAETQVLDLNTIKNQII